MIYFGRFHLFRYSSIWFHILFMYIFIYTCILFIYILIYTISHLFIYLFYNCYVFLRLLFIYPRVSHACMYKWSPEQNNRNHMHINKWNNASEWPETKIFWNFYFHTLIYIYIYIYKYININLNVNINNKIICVLYYIYSIDVCYTT